MNDDNENNDNDDDDDDGIPCAVDGVLKDDVCAAVPCSTSTASTVPASSARQDGPPPDADAARSRELAPSSLTDHMAAVDAYLRRNISMPRMAKRDHQGTSSEVAVKSVQENKK